MDFLNNPIAFFALYGSACYIFTFLVRRLVETASPGLRKQADVNSEKTTYLTTMARWWNEVILYSIAPLFGVLLALGLHGTELFPDRFKGSWTVTVMAGLTCGFLSGMLFKIFKKILARISGVDEKELNAPSNYPKAS